MVLKLVNPFTGDLIAEIPHDAGDTLDRKLELARATHGSWRDLPIDERVRQVARAIEWFRTNADEVARDITCQMGKPLAQSHSEITGMLGRAEHMMAIAERSLAADVLPDSDGASRRIEHLPHGVVLDLAAWNYPLLIAVNVVVPALLAGNVVLLKHSARTALCGAHFERAFATLDVPHLVTHLVLTHEQTAALLRDPRIDHVAFTGSVEGGRRVHEEASHRFVDTGLELGGKDPAYVAADADLETAVPSVVDGACYNAGQSCCAVERVYVHDSIHDEFLARAATVLESYVLGDPLDPATTLGPLAASTALDHLEAQVEDAVTRGARLLRGGRRSQCGRFFPPTLLADCPNEALVMQEESFGPLLPVAAVDSDDAALAAMNDSRFGLTASVWTTDRERAERFVAELETGTVYQNRCDFLDPALPWTGVKDSGKGSTLSRYGFLQLTRCKSVYLRG